jgi:hypothetical protein
MSSFFYCLLTDKSRSTDQAIAGGSQTKRPLVGEADLVAIFRLKRGTTARRKLSFSAARGNIVLLTGCVLLYPLWPSATALLLLKVAVGIIAVVSNVVCIHWVLGRARAKDDGEFYQYAKKVSWTGYTIPFGLLALALGLYGVS